MGKSRLGLGYREGKAFSQSNDWHSLIALGSKPVTSERENFLERQGVLFYAASISLFGACWKSGHVTSRLALTRLDFWTQRPLCFTRNGYSEAAQKGIAWKMPFKPFRPPLIRTAPQKGEDDLPPVKRRRISDEGDDLTTQRVQVRPSNTGLSAQKPSLVTPVRSGLAAQSTASKDDFVRSNANVVEAYYNVLW
jgi:hypothetical protein